MNKKVIILLVLFFVGGAIILMARRKKTTSTNVAPNTDKDMSSVDNNEVANDSISELFPKSDYDNLNGTFEEPSFSPKNTPTENVPVESAFIKDDTDTAQTVEVLEEAPVITEIPSNKIADAYIAKEDSVSVVQVANTAKSTLIKHPRKIVLTSKS